MRSWLLHEHVVEALARVVLASVMHSQKSLDVLLVLICAMRALLSPLAHVHDILGHTLL